MKKVKQWEYVKKKFERINELIRAGKLVVEYDEDDEMTILKNEFVITEKNEKGVPEVYYRDGPNCIFRYYEHTSEWDHGYWWSIKEINERLFNCLRAYEPINEPIFKSKNKKIKIN